LSVPARDDRETEAAPRTNPRYQDDFRSRVARKRFDLANSR